MKTSLAVALSLVCLPLWLAAKGPTLKVTLTGADLPAPAEMTDRRIAERFHVWSGEPPWTEGFIIAGPLKGPVSAPPESLTRYEVSFHVNHQGPRAYTVFWVFDPATVQGYVYLPGKGEKFYQSNTFLILRGIEGKWFSTTRAWTDAAKQAIEQAKFANR
jgi:hypothetical protein